tara:strand:+ start:68 stop:334 length:267 start_codon:yes stop_codon:yes gene_type:complete
MDASRAKAMGGKYTTLTMSQSSKMGVLCPLLSGMCEGLNQGTSTLFWQKRSIYKFFLIYNYKFADRIKTGIFGKGCTLYPVVAQLKAA